MTAATRAVDPMIAEFEQEAQTTQKFLERVPENKLAWKPHAKSMSLGQLALHVASILDGLSGFLETSGLDLDDVTFQAPQPENKAAILKTMEDSVAAARRRLEALDDRKAMESWMLHRKGAEVFSMPKIALARSLMLNHLYHHRGQLSVYLRLLDVPVPVAYGRSADENPFA